MDNLRAALARTAQAVARSRAMRSLRALLTPAPASRGKQKGQGLAEYALILGLIAIVAIVALVFLGTTVSGVYETIINEGFRRVTDLIG